MFRIESGPNLLNDGTDKAENGGSSVQSDVSFPSNPESVDESGPFKKNKGLPSNRSMSLDIQKSSVGCPVQQKSRSLSDEAFESGCTNGRMTDKMRDLRFNRIVMENLEKYPLDYDRLRLEKEAETSKERRKEQSGGFNEKALKEEGDFLHSNGPGFPSLYPSCSEADGSSMEPDDFWRMLHDDHWNEAEARLSSGSLSDGGTPVQGNSLPRDSWISPPVVPELSTVSAKFPAKNNDHITCELEGQFYSFTHFTYFFSRSSLYPSFALSSMWSLIHSFHQLDPFRFLVYSLLQFTVHLVDTTQYLALSNFL